ncbi:hypothetical protein QF026_005452 [Streptomyces aurantiacus]|nr:hypothetical protein [Streptomyces aurantiacus]
MAHTGGLGVGQLYTGELPALSGLLELSQPPTIVGRHPA